MSERRALRWSFIWRRRLRSTAMWVILWFSISSLFLAGRARFLFFFVGKGGGFEIWVCSSFVIDELGCLWKLFSDLVGECNLVVMQLSSSKSWIWGLVSGMQIWSFGSCNLKSVWKLGSWKDISGGASAVCNIWRNDILSFKLGRGKDRCEVASSFSKLKLSWLVNSCLKLHSTSKCSARNCKRNEVIKMMP